MIPVLRFYLDYQEDLSYVLFRITSFDPAGLEKRLKDKNFELKYARRIINAADEKKKREILGEYLKDYYQKHETEMSLVCQKYQDIWQNKQKIFFSTVTSIMLEAEWNYPEYLFLISSFYSKASWGTSNKLAVWWARNPENYWHLNGYELILTHYFEVIDRLYSPRPVSNWHLWALAETTAYLLTYKENPVKEKLWPQIKEPGRFSYPQLIKPINDLWSVYQKASNFKEFVEDSINYIKRYSQEDLTTPKV